MYWCFLDKAFKFQVDVPNGCHVVLLLSINLCDLVILNIRNVGYRCSVDGISKSKGINLLRNVDLNGKSETL